MSFNGTEMSYNSPNFSGLLFRKGKGGTPFSTMIGTRPKVTNSVEFPCGQMYEMDPGTQPAISENASLIAPKPVVVTRSQITNVTQIFQKAVSVSYAKLSNMGSMSGINVAGQQPNPMNALTFQIERQMEQIGRDIEYTFLNGQYAKALNDNQPNQTRGIVSAIQSNVIDMENKPLTYDLVAEGIKLIADQGGRTDNLILGATAASLLQLNKDAAKNNMTIVPGERTINGLAIDTILTPIGKVGVVLLDSLQAGTTIIFNPEVISPVFQETPDKGNFFLEALAKVGAGETYQLFGQVGLDHGPEWMAMKFTNVSKSTPGDEGRTPKVTLDKETASVAVGGTVRINARTVPTDETITWTSSDDTKATVANGVVTGVSEGTATITAKITVNSTDYSATTEVTVDAGA